MRFFSAYEYFSLLCFLFLFIGITKTNWKARNYIKKRRENETKKDKLA